MINYGPNKLKTHEISMQQYMHVIGAVRILVELLDSKQISSSDGIKQYFGYLIKIMELAMTFWVEVSTWIWWLIQATSSTLWCSMGSWKPPSSFVQIGTFTSWLSQFDRQKVQYW